MWRSSCRYRSRWADESWLLANLPLKQASRGTVNEGATSQTSPGVTWAFDYPAMWHNAYGTLALDRPNRFRLDGYWVVLPRRAARTRSDSSARVF